MNKTVALDEYTDLLPDGTIVKKAIVVDLKHRCTVCGKMIDWDNQTYTIHGEMICKNCVKKGTQYG